MLWAFAAWSTTYVTEALTITTVEATVPVNPVQTSAILSIHCQVWNLKTEQGEEVALYRKIDGSVKRLSIGDTVGDSTDERTFLAIRQMDDSVVYFLSITDATKDDAGEYSCRVIAVGDNIAQVASDSVKVDVAYFPSENPTCLPPESMHVTEGNVVRFQCISELTHPHVDIKWIRTDSRNKVQGKLTIMENALQSELTHRVASRDNGVIFICEISSKSFPGQTKTCPVGPNHSYTQYRCNG